MKYSVLRFVVDVAIDLDHAGDDYELEVTIDDVSAHKMLAPHTPVLLSQVSFDVSNRVRSLQR